MIDSLNGEYTLEILAADPALLKPLSWYWGKNKLNRKLGEMTVKFKGGSENADELYKLHKVKPEIIYTAPEEESHPLGVVI